MEDIIIDKIRKGYANEVWVAVREFNGEIYCDIREHYHPDERRGLV